MNRVDKTREKPPDEVESGREHPALLKLEAEAIEGRVAPSLFAFFSTATSTGTIDLSRSVHWGEPFHP